MATVETDNTATEESTGSPEEQEAQTAAQTAASRKKKTKAAGLIVGLTLVMMSIGYVFMPAAGEETEPLENTDAAAETLSKDISELEIGKFNCTNSKAGIDVSVQINFSLYASVLTSNKQDLKDAKEKYDARIRDAVNSVARSASRDDLHDPRLSTIKRSIREEINRIIHEHYIIEIVIPDWQTMER